jgi:hypothetical protein
MEGEVVELPLVLSSVPFVAAGEGMEGEVGERIDVVGYWKPRENEEKETRAVPKRRAPCVGRSGSG